jgi:diacylglycerol kinase family enzyme
MPAPTAHAPFIVVLNAGSGRGEAAQARAAMETCWREAGRSFEILPSDKAHPVPALARQAAAMARERGGIVVAAGGDGTLNAVAQALRGSSTALGVIPLGTFNYVARTLGIPSDAGAAAQALLDAHPVALQVGQVNGHAFLVNASVGLYPQLLEDREAFKAIYGRSRAVAMLSGLSTLLREPRQWRLRIETEQGRRELRTPTLFVGNNPMQLARIGLPEAEAVGAARGVLAAVVLRPVGTLRMLGLALQGALGQLGEAEQVESFAFRRLVADPVGLLRVKVALDGEVIRLRPPLVFEAAPPLPVLAPRTAPERD